MINHTSLLGVLGALVLLASSASLAETRVIIDYNDGDHANPVFKFQRVPEPSKTDAATKATFTLIAGERAEHSGSLDALHDGKLPSSDDEPAANFFFEAATEGGRVLIDLGSVTAIKQVNTYSWHRDTRGAQVYKLYAADAEGHGVNLRPANGSSPGECGWKLLAQVDTRPQAGGAGGQFGVSICDSDGTLATCRYLLFDSSRTESEDDWGNTFYSEIDVVSAHDTHLSKVGAFKSGSSAAPFVTCSQDGYCQITIDTTLAPELRGWAEQKLAPLLAAWYPKLTTMLASPGFTPPQTCKLILRPGHIMSGTNTCDAVTDGTCIRADSTWLKDNLNDWALGCLLHETIHVVQQYGWSSAPDAQPTPDWLSEGIADYIHWFLYQPQSHRADAVWFARTGTANIHFNDSYNVSASFLNYVFTHHDKDGHLLAKLNTVCREGKYRHDFWQEHTGKPLTELSDDWKVALRKEIATLRRGSSVRQAATSKAEP